MGRVEEQMDRVRARARECRWLWPVLPPLLVMYVGFQLFAVSLNKDFAFPLPARLPEPVPGAEAARFWVSSSFMLLIVASVAGVSVAAKVMRRLRRSAELVGYVVAAALFFGVVLNTYTGDCALLYLCLGKGVFMHTLGRAYVSLLEWISYFATLAVVLAAVMLTTAVAALGWQESAESDSAPELVARRLGQRLTQWKSLLLSASVLLFAGALHLKAWHDWPLPYLGDGKTSAGTAQPALSAAQASYNDVSLATVNFQSLHYVLILAAMFLPMAALLSHQINNLSEKAAPSGGAIDRQSWIKTQELSFSIPDQVKSILALISPFLAAPLVDGIKRLASL